MIALRHKKVFVAREVEALAFLAFPDIRTLRMDQGDDKMGYTTKKPRASSSAFWDECIRFCDRIYKKD